MSALELLDLKLSQQKTELELAKIDYTILQEYLDLLSSTDLLGKIPYKNYLSSGLEAFWIVSNVVSNVVGNWV